MKARENLQGWSDGLCVPILAGSLTSMIILLGIAKKKDEETLKALLSCEQFRLAIDHILDNPEIHDIPGEKVDGFKHDSTALTYARCDTEDGKVEELFNEVMDSSSSLKNPKSYEKKLTQNFLQRAQTKSRWPQSR